jgi:hypothetical protein
MNKPFRHVEASLRLCRLFTILRSSSVLSIIPDLRHPFYQRYIEYIFRPTFSPFILDFFSY